MNDDIFQSVLAAARTNAQWAWREIYDAHAPRVLQYARAQRSSDPEDIVGETFVRVVRSLHTFTGDEDSFRGWIFRIAQNVVRDLGGSRAIVLDADASQPAHDSDIADIIERQQSEQRLYRVLRALPADQRAVIFLRFAADLSLAEVAEIIGKRTSAVKMLQNRGLKTLRERDLNVDN